MSNPNKGEINFEQLIGLFRETHQELQMRAARSVDTSLVIRNWLFGWYIVEFEQGGASRTEMYGKKMMEHLARELTRTMGRGFSKRSLEQYRKFYECYKGIAQALPAQSLDPFIGWKKTQTVLTDLTVTAQTNLPEVLHETIKNITHHFVLGWSHYVVLMTISNSDERRFYEIEAHGNSWGYRELERQINSSLYERLALSKDKKGIRALSERGHIVEQAADIIKNPYILEFTGLEERPSYCEHELEAAIISKLEHFLLELGKGFLFEARQKRFTFDNDHFYVDLVFYNRLLRCYVIIDLKRNKLTHQDLGQMQMYVNYFDRYVKTKDELRTIGILLCHSKSNALVELTLPEDSNIFASQYQLYLPSKEELQRQLLEAMSEIGEKKS